MNERIVIIRKSLNFTQKEFAEKIGIKSAGLSNLETNQTRISERHIKSICAVYNVNEDW